LSFFLFEARLFSRERATEKNTQHEKLATKQNSKMATKIKTSFVVLVVDVQASG